jgi:hypothetical protein
MEYTDIREHTLGHRAGAETGLKVRNPNESQLCYVINKQGPNIISTPPLLPNTSQALNENLNS